jgi:hypothetical protein
MDWSRVRAVLRAWFGPPDDGLPTHPGGYSGPLREAWELALRQGERRIAQRDGRDAPEPPLDRAGNARTEPSIIDNVNAYLQDYPTPLSALTLILLIAGIASLTSASVPLGVALLVIAVPLSAWRYVLGRKRRHQRRN